MLPEPSKFSISRVSWLILAFCLFRRRLYGLNMRNPLNWALHIFQRVVIASVGNRCREWCKENGTFKLGLVKNVRKSAEKSGGQGHGLHTLDFDLVRQLVFTTQFNVPLKRHWNEFVKCLFVAALITACVFVSRVVASGHIRHHSWLPRQYHCDIHVALQCRVTISQSLLITMLWLLPTLRWGAMCVGRACSRSVKCRIQCGHS